jgi:phage FluMu gp28-like protein
MAIADGIYQRLYLLQQLEQADEDEARAEAGERPTA